MFLVKVFTLFSNPVACSGGPLTPLVICFVSILQYYIPHSPKTIPGIMNLSCMLLCWKITFWIIKACFLQIYRRLGVYKYDWF